MTPKTSSRPYRKKKRARQEQETRRRITEAAVELHGTVGPARTAITDIAKRAGVTRATVYSHFPTEVDLFAACSTHWASNNPFPDPSAWAAIEDPRERLLTALEDLYRWYREKRDMLGNVLRDIERVEALATVMGDLWLPWVKAIIDTLATGWPVKREGDDELRAALRLVVDFGTWRLLTGSGLTDGAAAALAAHMLATEFGAGRKPERTVE